MSPIEQAFEIAYLRDRDPKSPITIDALLRGADGQYFHQHMRTYFGFFCMGYSAGATDTMDARAQPKEVTTAPASEPKAIDPDCWGCFGMGDRQDKGHACQFCHTEFLF